MPKSALHEKKKMKNYAVLAAVVVFMVVVFLVTIVRLKTGMAQ